MNNLATKRISKPIKVDVVRIQDIFQNTNPYKSGINGIIKDYVYINQSRVIA